MLWLHPSPIPVGRGGGGVISCLKIYKTSIPNQPEGGWRSAPCGPGKETNQRIQVYIYSSLALTVSENCSYFLPSLTQVSYNIWNKILFINCAIAKGERTFSYRAYWLGNCTFLEDNVVPFARPLSSPFWPLLSSVRPPLSSIWTPLSSSPLLVGLTPVILALCVALIKNGYHCLLDVLDKIRA